MAKKRKSAKPSVPEAQKSAPLDETKVDPENKEAEVDAADMEPVEQAPEESAQPEENPQQAEDAQPPQAAQPEVNEAPDDGSEPALVETEEEPQAAEQPGEKYVNIQNPEDDEIYEAPRKPSTPQEQMQWAIDSIEKRAKYLDEPNVISDEAIDDIVSQISFYDDDE